jgi:DNA-directed RNA polymerase specialized sigma24 family protein
MVMRSRDYAGRRADASGAAGEIERLYRDRLPELRRVAAAVSGSRDAAADLVQEAFVRALRSAATQFRVSGSIEGWVWRIVVNVSLNHRRDRRSATALGDELAASPADDWGPGPVADAVRALPERQRLVLFLRYYADLDYDAIAHALGISSGTVGATLTAARSALFQALAVKEATS